MIPIFFQDTPQLATEEIPALLIGLGIFTPHRHFHLQIDTQLVCHTERSGRRTPGVEAHMVHTIFFQDTEYTFPRGIVHRSIAGLGEHCVFNGTAQVYGFAIKDDMVLTGLYFAHTESRAFLMRIGLALYTGSQLTVQRIKIGMELIPQMDILTQKHFFLDISNGIGHCYWYFLL